MILIIRFLDIYNLNYSINILLNLNIIFNCNSLNANQKNRKFKSKDCTNVLIL